MTDYSKNELQAIHSSSRRLNRLVKKDHEQALLKMMQEHIKEIKARHAKGDEHYLIETGDLIVLCLELIKEAKASVDETLFKCYPRFHNKLQQLIKEEKSL